MTIKYNTKKMFPTFSNKEPTESLYFSELKLKHCKHFVWYFIYYIQ